MQKKKTISREKNDNNNNSRTVEHVTANIIPHNMIFLFFHLCHRIHRKNNNKMI